MEKTNEKLYVKSHVARDLIQSADLFRTDKAVVWEYVSNGLQYIDAGVSPIVRVKLDNKNKKISISDNGRGMNWNGLQNFFIMHGENQDRKQGKVGRGRFGTGKSAAFGIANILRVTTIADEKLSKVQLKRSEIEKMNSEDQIPVHILEKESSISQANGTLIEIEEINLKTLDQIGIISYIEHHLAKWSKGVTVWVNNHECEFNEPPIAEKRVYKPEGEFTEVLGNVELILKVAKAPLDAELRGVSVFSNGVWHETTSAGNEGRDMAQYIFGEIDVPALDKDNSPITAFNVSRSMQLNKNNPLVREIHVFVGQKFDQLRRELLEVEKKRRADEEAKKLAGQASEIASVINEDFSAFRQKIAKAKAKAFGAFDNQIAQKDSSENEDLAWGTEIPAEIVSPTGGIGSVGESEKVDGKESRDLNPQVIENETSEKQGRRAEAEETQKSYGGFRVEFRNMGSENARASYTSDNRTISINLDHPQLVSARGNNSIDEPLFLKLSYEIAFTEYSIALAYELEKRNEFMDLTDPINQIRETLNRISRIAAALYKIK